MDETDLAEDEDDDDEESGRDHLFGDTIYNTASIYEWMSFIPTGGSRETFPLHMCVLMGKKGSW